MRTAGTAQPGTTHRSDAMSEKDSSGEWLLFGFPCSLAVASASKVIQLNFPLDEQLF